MLVRPDSACPEPPGVPLYSATPWPWSTISSPYVPSDGSRVSQAEILRLHRTNLTPRVIVDCIAQTLLVIDGSE